jgi:hypothetical protein
VGSEQWAVHSTQWALKPNGLPRLIVAANRHCQPPTAPAILHPSPELLRPKRLPGEEDWWDERLNPFYDNLPRM